ncbi:hypothetical protein B0H14DRAFT_3755712 [Mycena olivaceomarginata]|nr:hypothetical protein B0H14DRAFT_3755712 [Mycena olivaceomarginata]
MPKLKGRRILSSDGGSPPTALFDDERDAAPGPETPTRALSDDEESGRRTPLPSLETYMHGGVGLGVVSTLHSPFTPLAVRRADSLPGSSPIPTSPVHPSHSEDSQSEDSGSEGSGNEDEAPKILLYHDGLIHTSPVVGTKEQKKAKKWEKGAKKRKETMANKQSASAASAEECKAAVFEEVLETLSSNGLSFGQLMLYVFDPIYKQGVVRWNGPSARQEVGTWAEDYGAEAMRDEAQGITESKKLQTADTAIDNDYVTKFSMLSMGTYFQTAARISMKVLVAFATPPRNLKSGLVQRAGKHFTIITAAALSLLGEFSHKNNFSRRIMGLYLYATGAQRQTISVMSHLGISESYQNLIHSSRVMINRHRRIVNPEDNPPRIPPGTPNSSDVDRPYLPPEPEVLAAKIENLKRIVKPGTLQELSLSMRGFARVAASTGLFAASYDNINLVFRVAEQIIGRTGERDLRHHISVVESRRRTNADRRPGFRFLRSPTTHQEKPPLENYLQFGAISSLLSKPGKLEEIAGNILYFLAWFNILVIVEISVGSATLLLAPDLASRSSRPNGSLRWTNSGSMCLFEKQRRRTMECYALVHNPRLIQGNSTNCLALLTHPVRAAVEVQCAANKRAGEYTSPSPSVIPNRTSNWRLNLALCARSSSSSCTTCSSSASIQVVGALGYNTSIFTQSAGAVSNFICFDINIHYVILDPDAHATADVLVQNGPWEGKY